ncbi:hypothetical protein ANN_04005 [Periplaneta americana]|uniref:DUF4817 domain-containing protein n=1 Tax=Periplaneta americana TaxID=6978 RepID=A0ABQ8T7D4_PERAM|nr:hypothetical protein ANN_04005 [Periplaneta americana]
MSGKHIHQEEKRIKLLSFNNKGCLLPFDVKLVLFKSFHQKSYNEQTGSVVMERWSTEHRIPAVELFIKTDSVTATQRGFRLQFDTRHAPSHNTLVLWAQNGGVNKGYQATWMSSFGSHTSKCGTGSRSSAS